MMISCHEMMVLWHEMMISCHEMMTLMDGWAWYPPTKFLLSREIPYLSIPIPPLQIKQRLHVRHAASAQRGITSRLLKSECTEITTTWHSHFCSIPSTSLAHEIYPNAEHQQQRQKQTNESRKQ